MDIALIGGLFNGLIKGLDGLFTSDEERLQAKGAIMLTQTQVMGAVLQYEQELIKQKSAIIQAEAHGESWLQRSWRPIAMLTFLVLIVLRWTGLATPTLTPELESQLMTLVQIGLGGYVVGRSGEKIVKSLDLGNKNAGDD